MVPPPEVPPVMPPRSQGVVTEDDNAALSGGDDRGPDRVGERGQGFLDRRVAAPPLLDLLAENDLGVEKDEPEPASDIHHFGSGAPIAGEERDRRPPTLRDAVRFAHHPRDPCLPIVIPRDEDPPGCSSGDRVDLRIEASLGFGPSWLTDRGKTGGIDVVSEEDHDPLGGRAHQLAPQRLENGVAAAGRDTRVPDEVERAFDLVGGRCRGRRECSAWRDEEDRG